MPTYKPSTLQAAAAMLILFSGTVSSPAQQPRSADYPRPSRVDIYGGYAYIHPFHSAVAGIPYHDVGNINTTVSITDYFTRHLGLQVEGTYFSGGSKRAIAFQCSPSCASRDQLFYAAEAGPIVRFPAGRFTPFVHVLAGGARVNGPYAQPLTWGTGLTGGGGLDYTLPFAGNHLAIRLFQADMYYSHVDYPRSGTANSTTGGATTSNVGDVIALKGSAGLVLKLGTVGPPPAPLTLACNLQPENAHPGDPVTVTCMPGNLNPKRKAEYTFTPTGGQLTANGSSATISSASLAPGSYMVNAHLSQGPKPWQQASWTGRFTVWSFDPPVVTSCTADPAEVPTGTRTTLSATATSPQGRPLTISYSASAGQIEGSGPTASFSTMSLEPNPVTITCTATDDGGRSSSSSTTVTITRPSGASSSGTGSSSRALSQALCTISFERDRKRPLRVDNEAKACLDDIALNLNREYTDRLVILGHADPTEGPSAAAQRAHNESLYLIQEKGIDPSRLELRAAQSSGRAVDNLLLHRGAPSPAQPASTLVDASTLPQVGEAYGRPHAHPRQAAHRHAHRHPVQHAPGQH